MKHLKRNVTFLKRDYSSSLVLQKAGKVKQSRYRPGVVQRVPGS